jgi:hypothetical protein
MICVIEGSIASYAEVTAHCERPSAARAAHRPAAALDAAAATAAAGSWWCSSFPSWSRGSQICMRLPSPSTIILYAHITITLPTCRVLQSIPALVCSIIALKAILPGYLSLRRACRESLRNG